MSKACSNVLKLSVSVSPTTCSCRFVFHLDDRMSCRCSLYGSSAPLRLIVGSVVWTRLHFDTQLILVKLGRQWPVKWRQRIRPTTIFNQYTISMPHIHNICVDYMQNTATRPTINHNKTKSLSYLDILKMYIAVHVIMLHLKKKSSPPRWRLL